MSVSKVTMDIYGKFFCQFISHFLVISAIYFEKHLKKV